MANNKDLMEKPILTLRVDPSISPTPEARVVDGAILTLAMGGLNWVHVIRKRYPYATQEDDAVRDGLKVAQYFSEQVSDYLQIQILDGRKVDKQQRIKELKQEIASLEAE